MRAAICALVITVGLPASSVADVSAVAEEPATKLEAFMAQDGAVVIRGSSRVGGVRGEPGCVVAVESKEVKIVGSGERALGITVEVRRLDGRDPGRTSYVDFEELPSLLSGLEYMGRLERSASSLDQLEADYRTKGGLAVTLYNTSSGMKAVVASGVVGRATATLEFVDFLRLRQLLQSAYDALNVIQGEGK
jgi:hypothetical protein